MCIRDRDVCDRILEQDKGYLPALLTRQEAYFELHMAQQVVDDFYAIKDIYAGLAKPYELAAEVFHIYRQHKDVYKRQVLSGSWGDLEPYDGTAGNA